MKGRKPVPTQLKKLRGNPGHYPLNNAEPTPATLTKVPSPPNYLDGRGKYEWNRVGKELLDVGLLASIDRTMLANYCIAHSEVVETSRILTREGLRLTDAKGHVYRHPLIKVRDDARKAMRSFAVEFGISPSSRSRLKVTKPEKVDPFEEFLKSGKVLPEKEPVK